MTELLDAALLYASLGWKVFPLRPKAKEPATKHGFKDATTDGDAITAWWTENPNYNVGIATGDGLCVIDVDDKDKNAIQGSDSLREWEIANGDIAETCRAMTGSGGVHYFYDVGDTDIPCCQSKALAIDIRCDGGYVVAPPSVHPNGNSYVWDVSPDDLAPAKVGETEKACINWVYNSRNGSGEGGRRELRQIAREEGICLGYSASSKRAMLDEIVSERRYREIKGVTAVDLDGEVVS